MGQRITKKPPRFYYDYAIYFLTFCTYKRNPLLHQSGIPNLLIDNLMFYSKRVQKMIAYTIMPDHIHVIVEVKSVNEASNFLRDFKKYTSIEIKRFTSLHIPHVWQRGTMDHCIRYTPENEDFINHIEYLFYNSWKHLQISPKDYQYHNFKEIVEKGWLDEDFSDFDESDLEHVKIYE
jgi:REP element-mobilizing transposase RayT